MPCRVQTNNLSTNSWTKASIVCVPFTDVFLFVNDRYLVVIVVLVIKKDDVNSCYGDHGVELAVGVRPTTSCIWQKVLHSLMSLDKRMTETSN